MCEGDVFDQYISGQFVSADSTIGMNKVWVAPTDEVSFMLEKWEIYSFDGNPHPGLEAPKWYHNRSASFGFADGHAELRRDDDLQIVRWTRYTSDDSWWGPTHLWWPFRW